MNANKPESVKRIQLTDIKKYYWGISLLLGMLTMYMMLSYSGVLSTGKYCILEGDALEIYVPTIRNFVRNIVTGNAPYYSWNNFFGMNTSLAMTFYGAFNPFNILFLLFYKLDQNIVVATVIILKTGLSACCFQMFAKRVLKSEGFLSILFSIAYSMCSFQVTYNIVNFIWMDALYILPLVLLSIYLLGENGNSIPLTICYAYAFVTHLYMGYVVGIVSFLFFVLSIWLMEKKILKWKYIVKYIFSVLTAVFLTAIVWMPAAYFLFFHRAEDSADFKTIGFHLSDMYNQFFFGNNNLQPRNLPNLYCGIITLLSAPVFFLDKQIEFKKKLLFGILALVLFISCKVMPLYQLWHAFDAPDGWDYRFSFCLSFVMVCIALMAIQHFETIRIRTFIIIAGFNILFYMVEAIWYRLRGIDYVINDFLFLFINIVLMGIWILFAVWYRKAKKENNRKAILFACIFVMCAECVSNGYCAYYRGEDEYGLPGTTEALFYAWNDYQSELSEILDNNKGLYRVDVTGNYIINEDTYSGYNGTSDFCTTENPNLRKTFSKLGVATSPKVIHNYGMTDYLRMLIKYRVKAKKVNLLSTQEKNETDSLVEIRDFPYTLSFGFMCNSEILEENLAENNAFANNNLLFSALLGREINIFEPVDNSDIEIINDGITLVEDKDGFYFQTEGDKNDSYLIFCSQDDDKPLYLYIDNYSSFNTERTMLLLGGEEGDEEDGGKLSMSYLKKFEKAETETNLETEKDSLNVVLFSNGVKKQLFRNYYFAKMDEEVIGEVYNELSSYQLGVMEYGNGYIKGTVTSTDDKNVLFTSIPYDRDWNVIVDGKDVNKVPLLDGAFLGIQFENPGNHVVEMRFTPGWIKEGAIVSALGFAILLITWLVYNLMNGKRKASE